MENYRGDQESINTDSSNSSNSISSSIFSSNNSVSDSSSSSCSYCSKNTPIGGDCSYCSKKKTVFFSSSSSTSQSIVSNNSNNSKSLYSKNNHNHIAICNKITIDVAVLCQEYTTIEKMCHDHIINLDEIEITKDLFQCIFYPYYENFGINKNTVCNNCSYSEYISFLPEYRTVNGKKFYLLEEIISNIESDLNVSRNCFTVESLVELTNEIISINSFCDLNCCSVLSSLTWCNILEIIKNYNIVNDHCGGDCGPNSESTSQPVTPVIPICVISVIFKTPTPGVKNTIVRFNYRIVDL
jgi:hypothetical protein